MQAIISWLVVFCGLFALAGAIADSYWFFNQRRARFWVDRLGRSGARCFYSILGIAVTVLGTWLLFHPHHS